MFFFMQSNLVFIWNVLHKTRSETEAQGNSQLAYLENTSQSSLRVAVPTSREKNGREGALHVG